jgi:hypothetical protein
LDFGITIYLARVGFAKADDANALFDLREAEHVQARPKMTQRYITRLPVLSPIIDEDERSLEVKVDGRFERKAATANVQLILDWIELDAH